MMTISRTKAGWNAPGLRRVRLLCWRLFYGVPLTETIDEAKERQVAEHCGLTWEQYATLKAAHPELWKRWQAKRETAQRLGKTPPPPAQLARYRAKEAPKRASQRKVRPRFQQWAFQQLANAQSTDSPRVKLQIYERLDRLMWG